MRRWIYILIILIVIAGVMLIIKSRSTAGRNSSLEFRPVPTTKKDVSDTSKARVTPTTIPTITPTPRLTPTPKGTPTPRPTPTSRPTPTPTATPRPPLGVTPRPTPPISVTTQGDKEAVWANNGAASALASNRIECTWTVVPGCRYDIYRKTGNSPYVKLDNLPAALLDAAIPGQKVRYLDEQGLRPGTQYFYLVKKISPQGYEEIHAKFSVYVPVN